MNEKELVSKVLILDDSDFKEFTVDVGAMVETGERDLF